MYILLNNERNIWQMSIVLQFIKIVFFLLFHYM